MTIVFVSIALNIHQAAVSDELYRLTSGSFWFVETGAATAENSKGGSSDAFSARPYLIRVNNGPEAAQKAREVIHLADVMIYGAAPLSYLKERVRTGKLTFMYSERWLKRGWLNLLSPRLLKQQWFYHTHCRRKPLYALCASAYAAADFARMHSFKGKCYKWGYFTAVPELDIEEIQEKKRSHPKVRILWVARFLKLKHPEAMLRLASQLREQGISFTLNMIGTGPEYDRMAARVEQEGLGGCVHLLGNMPNGKVLEAMRSHDIFCFTSDKNEGWGAVLNEAMSNGCCPVSSIDTGSTPYLIQNGVNGFSFDLKDKEDLLEKVLWLIEHPETRERMSIAAYRTIRDVWSPKNAAEQFVRLCGAMLEGREPKITEGPCSKAL